MIKAPMFPLFTLNFVNLLNWAANEEQNYNEYFYLLVETLRF